MIHKKLTDILASDTDRDLRKQFEQIDAAPEFMALPRGVYIADAVSGELGTTKNGTPYYRLTFEVAEGEYAGRKLFHDAWLTSVALQYAKRDLTKLGITSLDQLERPLPPGICCRVTVVVHTDEHGKEWNKVKAFEVIDFDKPEPDPFSPPAITNATAAATPPSIPTITTKDSAPNFTDKEGGAS